MGFGFSVGDGRWGFEPEQWSWHWNRKMFSMVFIKGPALRKMNSANVPIIILFDSNERSCLLSCVLALLFKTYFLKREVLSGSPLWCHDFSQVCHNFARTHSREKKIACKQRAKHAISLDIHRLFFNFSNWFCEATPPVLGWKDLAWVLWLQNHTFFWY